MFYNNKKSAVTYEEENIKPVFGTVEILLEENTASTGVWVLSEKWDCILEFVCDAKKKTLQDIIKGKIVLQSNIYTDTWKSYRGLNKKGYHHETIDKNT